MHRQQDQDIETNTGWWIDKPLRQDRPSSYSPLDAGSYRRQSEERVWLRAAVIVALMIALGWAVWRLAKL